jgi:hypothetical protein
MLLCPLRDSQLSKPNNLDIRIAKIRLINPETPTIGESRVTKSSINPSSTESEKRIDA